MEELKTKKERGYTESSRGGEQRGRDSNRKRSEGKRKGHQGRFLKEFSFSEEEEERGETKGRIDRFFRGDVSMETAEANRI